MGSKLMKNLMNIRFETSIHLTSNLTQINNRGSFDPSPSFPTRIKKKMCEHHYSPGVVKLFVGT